MSRRDSASMRADKKFKELLHEVKIERLKKGVDKKPLSDRRLTLAISRIGNLKPILIDSEIKSKRTKK